MADKFGAVCGCEGAGVGINWTFSPVCDLDMNYLNPITNVRTFGSDLTRVKAFTAQYMAVVHRCGAAACAKHFPGDGVDYRDQHLHPTVNSLRAERYDPMADDLHGTKDLRPDRATLYFANYEQASNQTVVRVNWFCGVSPVDPFCGLPDTRL